MARQEHVLTVFVASPSDVDVERGKLEDIIREFNITWSRELGVRLELVRWETHAHPGMGDDSQAVINDQIPDDYDIFIGIMWCRYGTPTGRAGSGTIEEFERAKKRHDENPSSVKLMVYFKNDPPASLDKLDPSQLAKINEFRNSLGTEGALYWQYKGINQYEILIRLHLTRQIQAWKKGQGQFASLETPVSETASEKKECDEEDVGILDLMEIFEDKFEILNGTINRIGKATEDLGQKMNDRTAEMDGLPRDSQGNANRKDAKRLIAKAASDMDQYTAAVNADLPLFSEALNTGMNSLIRVATMSIDLKSDEDDVEQAKESLEAIVAFRDNLVTVKNSTSEFRETIAALPRMTTALNKSKRGVTQVLDILLEEFANGETLLNESEKVVHELIGSPCEEVN